MKNILLFLSGLLSISTSYAQVGFTPNHGQFADQSGKPVDNVLFKACGTGPGIFVTTTGLTYVFEESREELVRPIDSEIATENGVKKTLDWSAIHMTLIGADIRAENIVMEDELPGVSNYYYAHCPQGIVGVKSYHKITIKEIYPGIDWIITADEVNGVAHDFLVKENGNHNMVRMNYAGLTSPLTVNEKNQLTLKSAIGTIYEGGLKVFRENSNSPIPAYFYVNGNEVSYLIVRGGRQPMIIDPPLQWDSLLTSSGMDYGSGVAATRDGSGDVLGCGYTDGIDFPVVNATQGSLSGQEDAIVYRLDANGNRLWATYFGGTDIDNAKGIATDMGGNAYITGQTASQDLPVMNSLQPNYGGGVYDAFIAKYNPSGVLQWASWRGGTGSDFGTALAITNAGTVYVVGYTNSTLNFPLLNPIQATLGGVYDGFIMKLDITQLMYWSTYYGGTDEDKFRSVAIDVSQNSVLIGGNTYSGNFPTAGTPFQLYNAQPWSNSDGVILRINDLQSVVFASYCGGTDDDVVTSITCDAADNIYATGYTLSSDFPTVSISAAYNDSTQNGPATQDAFVVKVSQYGTALLWSTYFGGTATDYAYGIVFDHFFGVYVCGVTSSTDFPVMQPADLNYYQSAHGDGGIYNDAWIAWFNENDTLSWSTYFGGPNSEEAYSVSVGGQNEIFMTGVDSNEISIAKFNPGLPTGVVGTAEISLDQLYPIPAYNTLNLDFYSSRNGVTTIEVIDVQGRIVKREEFTTTIGRHNEVIDVTSLAEGAYMLRLIKPEGKSTLRFAKTE